MRRWAWAIVFVAQHVQAATPPLQLVDSPEGARIASARPDTGLLPNDLVVAVDWHQTKRQTASRVMSFLTQHDPGDNAGIEVLRGARTITATVQFPSLDRRPKPPPPIQENALPAPGWWGATLDESARVTKVEDCSPADVANVHVDDRVLGVDDTWVERWHASTIQAVITNRGPNATVSLQLSNRQVTVKLVPNRMDPRVGQPASTWEKPLFGGALPEEIESLRDRVVVVVLWSACQNCYGIYDAMADLIAKHPNVRVIFTQTTLLPIDDATSLLRGLPAVFVIDRTGRIAQVQERTLDRGRLESCVAHKLTK